MIFGAATAEAKPLPKVTAGGAVPVAQISESTVRVDVDAMMRERGQPEAAPSDRQGRTQLFALNDQRNEKTPPEAFASHTPGGQAKLDATPSRAPNLRQERTQLFSVNEGKPTKRSELVDATLPPDGPMRSTMMFGSPNADTSPDGLPGVTPELLKMDLEDANTSPDLAPTGGGVGSRNIRSDAGATQQDDEPFDGDAQSISSSQDLSPVSSEDSADFAAIEKSTRRRNVIAVIVLLMAVLAAAAAVWQFSKSQAQDPQKIVVPKAAEPAP